MDVFSVYLSFCHICLHTSLSWFSKRFSHANSDLHKFVHPILVMLPQHMSTQSHPATSSSSCDRLNSYQFSKLFASPSVFHECTTYLISIGGFRDVRHSQIFRNFIQPFVILAVAARSVPPISIKSVSQITNALYTRIRFSIYHYVYS